MTEISASTVVLPMRVAAFLVAESVHHLWQSDDVGCCYHCCAPCTALKEMLDTGQLDRLYGAYVDICGGGEHYTWDSEKRQVQREWLAVAWAGPCLQCDEAVNNDDA